MSLQSITSGLSSTLNQGPVSLTVASKIKHMKCLRETLHENKLTVLAKRVGRFVATYFSVFPAAFVGMVYHGFNGISLSLYPERRFHQDLTQQQQLKNKEMRDALVDASVCWLPGSEFFIALINSLFSNSLVESA